MKRSTPLTKDLVAMCLDLKSKTVVYQLQSGYTSENGNMPFGETHKTQKQFIKIHIWFTINFRHYFELVMHM